MTLSNAEELKSQGNEAYQHGDYRQALVFFSKGLELSSGSANDYLLFSNRSATYTQLGDHQRALSDAEKVTQMKPDWPKGWSRKAQALVSLTFFKEAITAFETGLHLDSANEVMSKGLEECIQKLARTECKGFDKTVTEKTLQDIESSKNLTQLHEVIWHLEITKERIWLEDGPKTPFRPRSIFLIDPTKMQIANVAPHCVRDSITLDELLQFFVQSCRKHNIKPGSLELSDGKLAVLFQQNISESMNIAVRCVQMTETKRKFVDDTCKAFDAQEQLQWANLPQYAGVLQQRAQRGLLTIPNVDFALLQSLHKAAVAFYFSKVFIYFTQGVGIRLEQNSETRVALVIRNAKGQYGLAMTTVEDARDSQHYGSQAVMFVDINELPFDDCDLIEQNGWKIVEDKYPFPVVFSDSSGKAITNDATSDAAESQSSLPQHVILQRPSADDLRWYELAFRAFTLFISNTYADPMFLYNNNFHTQPNRQQPTLCSRCIVNSHNGRCSVIVSSPPSHDAVASETFSEASNSVSNISSPSNSPCSSPTSQRRAASPVRVVELASVHTQQFSPPVGHQQQFAASSSFDKGGIPPVHAPTPRATRKPLTPPSSPPPAVPRAELMPALQDDSKTYNSECAVPYHHISAENGPWHKALKELPAERNKFEMEREEMQSIIEILRGSIRHQNFAESNHNFLESQLAEANTKIQWQATMIKEQGALIAQMQSQMKVGDVDVNRLTHRIKELEEMQMHLVKELGSKAKDEIIGSRQLFKEFNSSLRSLRKENTEQQQQALHLKQPQQSIIPSSSSIALTNLSSSQSAQLKLIRSKNVELSARSFNNAMLSLNSNAGSLLSFARPPSPRPPLATTQLPKSSARPNRASSASRTRLASSNLKNSSFSSSSSVGGGRRRSKALDELSQEDFRSDSTSKEKSNGSLSGSPHSSTSCVVPPPPSVLPRKQPPSQHLTSTLTGNNRSNNESHVSSPLFPSSHSSFPVSTDREPPRSSSVPPSFKHQAINFAQTSLPQTSAKNNYVYQMPFANNTSSGGMIMPPSVGLSSQSADRYWQQRQDIWNHTSLPPTIISGNNFL